MGFFYRALIFVAVSTALTQCRPSQKIDVEAPPLQKHSYQQAMMGTRFFITLYTDDKPQADKAATAAFQYAADVNSACSDYDVTSELMKFNGAPHQTALPLSPMLCDVLSTALDIAEKTRGSYDPTLGHHSYNWRMARKKGTLPFHEKITAAKTSSGWGNLHVNSKQKTATKLLPNMRLDLGGIAKGYAADGMLEVLKKHGIPCASITAGGEVRLGNPPPNKNGWDITLKTLDANHQLSPETLVLSNCGVSTSGDLHQSITINGQRYSHIVNPTTGLGLTTRVSATIIAANATLSDALATACCVDPTLSYPEVRTLVILEQPDGTLKRLQSKN